VRLLMSQLSAFDAINSDHVEGSLWVVVVCKEHRWEMVAAVEVAMVTMTLRGGPTGDARSRSTSRIISKTV